MRFAFVTFPLVFIGCSSKPIVTETNAQGAKLSHPSREIAATEHVPPINSGLDRRAVRVLEAMYPPRTGSVSSWSMRNSVQENEREIFCFEQTVGGVGTGSLTKVVFGGKEVGATDGSTIAVQVSVFSENCPR